MSKVEWFITGVAVSFWVAIVLAYICEYLPPPKK